MAIKTTTWWPDTCPCQCQYTWDDITTEDNRVHTFFSIVPCFIHQPSAPVPLNQYNNCLADNQKKNQAVGIAATTALTTPDKISFSLAADRTLTLGIPGIAALVITAIQTALTTAGLTGIVVTANAVQAIGKPS